MQRFAPPLAIGFFGAAILICLGIWQVQRLEWKQTKLATIEERLTAIPRTLPLEYDAERDNYLPVTAAGYTAQGSIFVLVSRNGPGFRRIVPFETEKRRVLLDQGFTKERRSSKSGVAFEVTGNLHWPDEVDNLFTPEPDGELWFARDVAAMAAALGTEPLMIVARSLSTAQSEVVPWPVGTGGIPNNHFQYALTWFALAIVWILMTAFWLLRLRRQDSGPQRILKDE